MDRSSVYARVVSVYIYIICIRVPSRRRRGEREKEEKTKELVGNFFSPQMSLSVLSFKFAKASIETRCRQKENNIIISYISVHTSSEIFKYTRYIYKYMGMYNIHTQYRLGSILSLSSPPIRPVSRHINSVLIIIIIIIVCV